MRPYTTAFRYPFFRFFFVILPMIRAAGNPIRAGHVINRSLTAVYAHGTRRVAIYRKLDPEASAGSGWSNSFLLRELLLRVNYSVGRGQSWISQFIDLSFIELSRVHCLLFSILRMRVSVVYIHLKIYHNYTFLHMQLVLKQVY